MCWTTLISADELAAHIDQCVVIDTRHELQDAQAGRRLYGEGHIPGAVFLHQDEDLAGARNGRNGRHPLPDRVRLAAQLARAGLSQAKQLVVYDAQGGQFAVRLWWLARWLGHAPVAVLDGGLDGWKRAGFPVTTVASQPLTGNFQEGEPLVSVVSADEVLANLATGARLVIDARAPERYRGEVEPLDPVAGHIPGALNRPLGMNLRPDGRFKPAEILRAELLSQIGTRAPADIVNQCGSGITACHNILAMELAGLSGSALYPGSWSEWCADPARPVAKGTEPG